MFESTIQPLTGAIDIEVRDPAGTVPEKHIIQIPDAWQVRVQWEIEGDAVWGLAATAEWEVRVSLESLGQGFEGDVASTTVALGAPAFDHSYDETLNIPGNFDPDLTPGAYKLVTVVTLKNGMAPVPVAGYFEGPILQFYDFS